MTIQQKIQNKIQDIFTDEGILDELPSSSEIKDVIDDEYLIAFRSLEDYKDNKKGYEIGESTEKERRKAYESEFDEVRLNYFIRDNDDERLKGLLYKEELNDLFPELLLNYYYLMFSKETESKILLSFLSAIFDKNYTLNIELYRKFLTLHGLFEPYFSDLDSTFEYFKSIEQDEDKKGLNPSVMLSPLALPFRKKSENELYYAERPEVTSGIKPGSDTDIFNEIDLVLSGLEKIIKSKNKSSLIAEKEDEQYYRKYFDNDFIQNLVSSLAKEYGEEEEIKKLLEIFLTSIGYDSEEVIRFLYLFVFPDLDFSECDPDPDIRDDKEETTNCTDDFYDPLPADWTRSESNIIYFDENSCSYCLVFTTDYENTAKKSIEDMQKEYAPQISSDMLRYLNKIEDQESKDLVSKNLIFDQYYINPKPLLKIKLLVKLKKDILKDLSDKPVSTEESELSVTYNIKDFFINMESFSEIMRIYEQKLVIDALKGNNLYYADLDFRKESQSMIDFSNNLSNLIKPIDFYENITIGFTGDKITSVELTREGYKKRQIVNGLESFSSSSPQTRSRTINFVKNLEEIIEYFKQNRTSTYDKFIERFFVPVPPRNLTKNNISNYADGAQQPIGAAQFGEIAKRSLDMVAYEIKKGYVSFSCMSDEEKNILIEQSEADLETKKKFGEQLKVNIEDRFLLETPEIFNKIAAGEGKQALDSLGRDFLNRLGVCGIGDIVSLATNTITSFMEPQEYMNELLKCAVSKMDPEDVKTFYNKVNTTEFLNDLDEGTNFLNTYRSMVADNLFPWETAPNVSGPEGLDANLLNLVGVEDYELRIRAFGDALVVSFDTTQLLNLLNDVPGGEWIRFFIELSDSIIKQCRIVDTGDGLITNTKLKIDTGNRCEGEGSKVKWPVIPKLKSTKPKTITQQIAENAKEILINLTVKIITNSFRELMTTASAALAFDIDYFKRGNQLPEFFQDKKYFYHIIRESSNKASITDQQICEMFLETLNEMGLEGVEELEQKSIQSFLENSALVTDVKEKIDLLRGVPSKASMINILEASQTNGVARILKKDPSKIGDVFSSYGKDVNINKIEEEIFNDLEDFNTDPSYCVDRSKQDYQRALQNNKGLTEEEANEQRNQQLEREKEKICNLSELVANPIAPIFGNALEKVFSSSGPIFGVLEEEKFNVFKNSIQSELNLMTSPMEIDLFKPRDGFLELMLHSEKGYTKTRSEFFELGEGEPGSAYESFRNDFEKNTNFQYNPQIGKDSYYIKFPTVGSIRLKQDISGETKIITSGSVVSQYTTAYKPASLFKEEEVEVPAYYTTEGASEITITETVRTKTDDLNKTASNMYRTLQENINISDENFEKENVVNNIITNNMYLLVERYYGNIKREMLQSKSFSYDEWEKIYNFMTKDRISKLLDTKNMVEKELLFYQKLAPDSRLGESKKNIYESPFDRVLTKEDYIRASSFVDLMIKTYTIEMIFKSFFSFRTFSEKFFEDLDAISNYVIDFMEEDMGEDYNLFSDLLMQVYLSKINLGIQEIVNEDAKRSYNFLLENLSEYRDQEREDSEVFLSVNSAYIKDLIADYSERVISSTVSSFGNTFTPLVQNLDSFILGPLIQKENIRNVVKDASVSEDFLKLLGSSYDKTRLVVEKFIFVKEKQNIPFIFEDQIKRRNSSLFGVVNLESWDTYLNTYKDDFSGLNISNLWDSWEFGLRISYIMPKQIDKNPENEDDINKNKAYNVTFNDEEITLIPLATIKKEIPDQEITSNISNEYDLSCLVYDLAQSEEYKNLFRDIIDIETLISLLTIYSMNKFTEFLGSGDPGKDLNRWLRDPRSFEDTKKSIIKILKDF